MFDKLINVISFWQFDCQWSCFNDMFPSFSSSLKIICIFIKFKENRITRNGMMDWVIKWTHCIYFLFLKISFWFDNEKKCDNFNWSFPLVFIVSFFVVLTCISYTLFLIWLFMHILGIKESLVWLYIIVYSVGNRFRSRSWFILNP